VQLSTDRHQVLARYRAVQKYLPYFDYIVHISSDVLPVNRSKSIEDIILQSPDKDVIFNFRYTCHKIERSHCAYHYSTELIIIKNSPRGREFVERMLAGSGKLRARVSRGHQALSSHSRRRRQPAGYVVGHGYAARCGDENEWPE
jgi:hypothetical protein